MINVTGYRRSGSVKYNAVLDWNITTDIVTEPLLLPELKSHLNMVFETDGSYEFDDDDAKLTLLITECRVALEKYTGCSFGAKTMQAIIRNEKGNQEIPYGPVDSVTSTVTEDGEAIEDVKIRGLQFKWVESPYNCYMHLTYTGGYAVLPLDLKLALKEECAYRYKNRGDQSDGVRSESARNLANPYRRTTWLL